MDKTMRSRGRRARRYCQVFGCTNTSNNKPRLTFFSLPKDDQQRKIWLKLIDREDLLQKTNIVAKSYNICEAHFGKDAVNPKIVKQLNDDALPTRFLPRQIHEENAQSADELDERPDEAGGRRDEPRPAAARAAKATQTRAPPLCSDACALRRKLGYKKLRASESKRRKLEGRIIKIEKQLEKNNSMLSFDPRDEIAQRFHKLMEWQNKIKDKFRGNRFDAEYKRFALNLHYSSPRAYRCLRASLKLPSRSTLARFRFTIAPAVDERLLLGLAAKVKALPAEARPCAACLGEMPLTRQLHYDTAADALRGFHDVGGAARGEVADAAAVLLLQGLCGRAAAAWRQPLGYALLAGSAGRHAAALRAWLWALLRRLRALDLHVKALVVEHGSALDRCMRADADITARKPYFYVDEQKVYYVSDVPRLLVDLHADLRSRDLHVDGELVRWGHVETLHALQKGKTSSLIPKITDAHVESNPREMNTLNKTEHSIQIFSASVSAALEALVDFGRLPESARPTAKFLKTVNDIFDVLNSSRVESVNILKSAFKMSPEQKKVLETGREMFAAIGAKGVPVGADDSNRSETCVGFAATIEAVLRLFDDLKVEGFDHLCTRRLNLDNLRTFLEDVRRQQKGGNWKKPTSPQFTRAFSHSFFAYMMKSSPAKREADVYEILLRADEMLGDAALRPPVAERRASLVALADADYRLRLPARGALRYVAAFLLHKCARKHECAAFAAALRALPPLPPPSPPHLNENAPFYGLLKTPPEELYQYVQKLEGIFVRNFSKCLFDRPGSSMFSLLKAAGAAGAERAAGAAEGAAWCVSPCACFPTEHLLKLFVRLRIYTALRDHNANKHANKLLKLTPLT